MQTGQDRISKLVTERTTLRMAIAALIGLLLGIVLLYLSGVPGIWTGREAWQSVVRDLGVLFVGTVAVAMLWELWGKRALLDEMLAKAQLAEQIRSAGLIRFSRSFHGNGWDWDTLLSTTNRLDVFFAYGRTWRRICQNSLVELTAKESSKIRVVLPDPEDDVSIRSMADRFETTPDELKRQVYEAKEFFQSLVPENVRQGEKVTVKFRRGTTLFSFYILDNIAIATFYAHMSKTFGPMASPAPTLIISRDGWMFDWLQDEFNRMVTETDGRTRSAKSE